MDYGRNLNPSFLVPLILGLWKEPKEEAAHLMEDRKEGNRKLMGEEGERRGEERRGERTREKRGDTNGRQEMRRRD